MAVDPAGVIGLELLFHGGRRGRRPGDGDSESHGVSLLRGDGVEKRLPGLAGEGRQLSGVRRVVVDMTLAHPDDPGGDGDVEARRATDADDELGRAAADVDHDRGLGGRRPTGHRSEEGQLGLLLAAQDPGVQSVTLADPAGEVLTVGGIAHRRGHDGQVGLAVVGIDLPAVVGERLEDPADGLLRQRPAGIHSLPPAG